IINNSDLSVKVNYDIPIYSRADTKIQPIKSQQELQDLLHEAILTNSAQAIMQVVKAGANVNLFKDGKAPLMWATILKKFNAVEVLKKCGAVIPDPKNMLYRAILNDSYDDVKHAIEAGASPHEEHLPGRTGMYPLGIAVFLAKSRAVDALLDCGASLIKIYCTAARAQVDKRIRNLLSYALLKKDIKTALILLKHDQHKQLVRNFSHDIFEYVVREIDPSEIQDLILEFIQECIDHGYDINSPYSTSSVVSNECVRYKNAWVSAINSPFFSVEILKLLMKNGANPNQLIHDGSCYWTPLHFAIQANNVGVVKFLLNEGADLTKKAGPSMPSSRKTVNPPGTPLCYARAVAFASHVENDEI